MQSIFRPASRREALGERSGGGRRDGGLKMGWTKLSGCGDSYGYRSQLQKELGLLIGPKDPLLALWVSQREMPRWRDLSVGLYVPLLEFNHPPLKNS